MRLGEAADGGGDRWRPEKALPFQEAAEEALELMAHRTRPLTVRERRRILEKDILPAWGDRLAKDIRRADVVALAREIAARGSPVMANRTLSLIRALFNAMLDLEMVDANPATRLHRFLQEEKPRARALAKGTLKGIRKAVQEEGPKARAFVGLCLFTVQRAGAVAASRWGEFDLEAETWTIPPEAGRKFKGSNPAPDILA